MDGPEQTPKKKGSRRMIGAGLAIGIGVGVALDNMAVGVAVGLAIGVAMDSYRRDKESNQKDDSSEA
jgi:F0F1-type ATP synthase membrane subunit c/vacuolar-type H+-ATPase subunit K